MTKILPKFKLVTIEPKYARISMTPAKAMLNPMDLSSLSWPWVEMK
jgi:hypothetical protein